MINRRTLSMSMGVAAGLAAMPVSAAETKPFSQPAFDAAQAAGKPILIEVTAPWCPTCKVQKPILSSLATKPKFKELAIFEIDFDSQKDLLRTLRVQQQSTLIVYKGKQEVGRSTGDTNAASIETLLSKSI